MSIRKLIRLTTKAGIGGGAVYYYYEVGLWKNTDETLKNFQVLKQDVNLFLESSPALVDYIKCAKASVSDNLNSATQPISDFRKEWLDYDVSWLTGSDGNIIKTGWNKGVGVIVDVIVASPKTIASLSVGGWNKLKELSDSTLATETSSSPNNNTNETST